MRLTIPTSSSPATLVHRWLSARQTMPALLFVLSLSALALYLRTSARTITWAHGGADGAELSAAAAILGVAHPPGYPLYLLLGYLFAQIPVGEVAFRVGLLSVVSGAVGVGLAAYIAGRLGGHGPHPDPLPKREGVSRLPLPAGEGRGEGSPLITHHSSLVGALAAGAALATSPLYWSQATIPEVYALHAALVLGALALLVDWRPGRDRLLVYLALLFGVGLGNHLTLLLLAGPAALYVLARDPRVLRRRIAILAPAAFLVGLLVYAYLPIRASANPALNWGNPSDLPRFVAHVTARSYQGYFASRPPGEQAARIPMIARLTVEQFTWPGLVVALLGLGELMRRRASLARLLTAYLLLTGGFTLFYNAKDSEIYLLPAALVLSICLGVGMSEVARTRAGPTLALAATVALSTWQIYSYGPKIDLSSDRAAADYAQQTLSTVAPEAPVLTENDEQTFALWYFQIIKGLRPDVVVVDRRGLPLDWYRSSMEERYPGILERLPE